MPVGSRPWFQRGRHGWAGRRGSPATRLGVKCAVKQIRRAGFPRFPRRRAAASWREAFTGGGAPPIYHDTARGVPERHIPLLCAELAPGGDLFASTCTRTAYPRRRRASACTCVALALRHVHSHGWVYRDVKLENVLIDRDGYIKICDFGFAKKAASTRTFTKCGTDEYAPPEVVSGRGRSCAADWWALGILLHEMLTGRPPFEGSSAEEVSGNPDSPLRYLPQPLFLSLAMHPHARDDVAITYPCSRAALAAMHVFFPVALRVACTHSIADALLPAPTCPIPPACPAQVFRSISEFSNGGSQAAGACSVRFSRLRNGSPIPARSS